MSAAIAIAESETQAYRSHLQGLLTALARKTQVPGICLQVSGNGTQIGASVGNLHVAGGAAMSAGARFQIGGMNKVLLSLVVLELAAAGTLDLDGNLGALLSELAGSEVGERVLLRHLLCHGGGYASVNFADPQVRNQYSWEQLVDFLRATPMLFQPGTVFSYTPTVPVLLAEIIHRTTGLQPMQAVQSRVLAALGLAWGTQQCDAVLPEVGVGSHAFDPGTHKFLPTVTPQSSELWSPAFSTLTLSVSDLATLAHSIATARQGGIDGFLSEPAARLAQQQVITVPFVSGHKQSGPLPLSVGLGCAEFLPGWIGSDGAFTGQSSCFRYHAQHRLAVAIGVNAHVPLLREAIVQEVVRSLLGDCVLLEPPIATDTPAAQELAGSYLGTLSGMASVSAEGQDVICELHLRPGAPRQRVLLRQDHYRRWAVRSETPVSIGVFRDPSSGVPCLMIGPSAYRHS